LIYNFDTENIHAAIGALIVYGIYRSRDATFKVTPDMWGRIERAVISSAKRAEDLGDFLRKLKPKLKCSTINPRYFEGFNMLDYPDQKEVLDFLYRKGSIAVLLVRERLERERG